MYVTFIAFLVLFLAVGLWAARKGTGTSEDYLLAGKNVNPWMAGLSLFATENSGVMFVGFVGMAYVMGVSAFWIVIGWYLGEIIAMTLFSHHLRLQTEKSGAQTYSQLIAGWTGQEYSLVRILSALLIIVFLCVFAAAQLSAGGKALNVLSGIDFKMSAVIGFVIILGYCFFGGLRASIWTDVLQAGTMFVSLFLISALALIELGGLGGLVDSLRVIDPGLLDMFGGSYQFGLAAFVAGWLFAGAGVLGQSYIAIRFMVVDRAENTGKVVLSYSFMVFVLAILSTTAALCARALMPELEDPELSLPMISSEYMPEILAGLFLAGLFAATISTADSQILSSAAALSHDLFPKGGSNITWTRLGTVLVAGAALGIVLSGQDNVFVLATFSWAFMAASMAPLVVLYCLGYRPSQGHALLMMLGGIAASAVWKMAGLNSAIYFVMPGIVAGFALFFIPYWAGKILRRRSD